MPSPAFARPAILACVLTATPAHAALTHLDIYNNALFQQTSTAAPIVATGYFFSMGGMFQTPGEFTTASVSYPNQGFRQQTINGTSFSYGSPVFSSLSSLHAAYPFGTYTTTVQNTATNASQQGSIVYTADFFASARPAVTAATYTSLQGMNPAAPLTLSFNSYSRNANTNAAYTFVFIMDQLTGATVYTQPFLPTSTTSVVVPPNTLLPDRDYRVHLDFTNRIGFVSANILLTQGFDMRTDIPFTTGAVPEPATLALLACAAPLLASRRSRTNR